MKCPNCDFIEKDEAFGDPAICPKCGAVYEKALRAKAFRDKFEREQAHTVLPAAEGHNKPARKKFVPPTAQAIDTGAMHVKITDIDLPFWSMVQILVKWALASIPALLILMLIFVGFTSLFGVLFR